MKCMQQISWNACNIHTGIPAADKLECMQQRSWNTAIDHYTRSGRRRLSSEVRAKKPSRCSASKHTRWQMPPCAQTPIDNLNAHTETLLQTTSPWFITATNWASTLYRWFRTKVIWIRQRLCCLMNVAALAVSICVCQLWENLLAAIWYIQDSFFDRY